MSIENELSSDIALALLARGVKDPEQLKEMKELILGIHATLQEKDIERKTVRTRAAGAEGSSQSESKAGPN